MAEKEEITLFIDLGTNGEMAIGNKDRIIACSTAAGPAFEGGPTKGVFGADMIHLCAELCRNKLLDETGLLADPYFEDGIFIGNVLVTKEAIRNLQMAKAAIMVGIKTLIEQFGLSKAEEVDKVILAGGFGYFLNPADAARLACCHQPYATKLYPEEIPFWQVFYGMALMKRAGKGYNRSRKKRKF